MIIDDRKQGDCSALSRKGEDCACTAQHGEVLHEQGLLVCKKVRG